MHLVSVALLHVDFDGWMPCNSSLFIVSEVKVVNDVFIGANKAFEVCLDFFNWPAHVNCEASGDLRRVVESLDGQFALIRQENDHAFLIDLIV